MRLLFIAFACCFLLQPIVGSGQTIAPSAVALPPVHPVEEATLRRYFDVCHFGERNRAQIDVQLAAQQRTLPSWYPQIVWNEIVRSIDAIDVAAVALPIYQRYWSEEAARNATRLFLTPVGQAMVKKVYEKTEQQENAGDPALKARQEALDAVRSEEDAKIREMMASMTPKEQHETEVFVRSPEWARLNSLNGEIAKEFSEAYVKEQEKAMHKVLEQRHADVDRAHDGYAKSHPGAPVE